MKILLECCIPAKSLSHASLVIINWLTTGQIEDWISFTPCIRALVYPEGVKGVQSPLNVFNCVFAQKILYKLCSCVHYILNFVQENVKNCTRMLNFTFCFRVCFILLRPRPLARSPFRKFLIFHLWTPCTVKIWVRRCYGSVSYVWFWPWFRPGPAGELIGKRYHWATPP